MLKFHSRAASRLRKDGLQVSTGGKGSRPAAMIVETAEEGDFDLNLLPTNGRAGLPRKVFEANLGRLLTLFAANLLDNCGVLRSAVEGTHRDLLPLQNGQS